VPILLGLILVVLVIVVVRMMRNRNAVDRYVEERN
jgi:hypothetical protein